MRETLPNGTEVIYQNRQGFIVKAQDDGWQYTIRVGEIVLNDIPHFHLTVVPKVGLGATMRYYSDRTACTIIAVSASGRKVTVQEDKAVRTDDNGMSDCQIYRYDRDPAGRLHTFYRQGNGSYAISGVGLDIGFRNAYHDYSF